MERPGKVQLALHCPLGNLRDPGFHPGIIGQLIDAFLTDHGRIHVGDEQPLLALTWRKNDDVDAFPAFIGCAGRGAIGIDFNVGGVPFVNPTQKARAGMPRQRRIQQSFVEPSGCYQRSDGQG